MKQRTNANGKNLIGDRLKELRNHNNLSQRDLARELQLIGMDMDKNVITIIETTILRMESINTNYISNLVYLYPF